MQVILEPRFQDNRLVGGKYHLASHTIFLYKEEIVRQCCELFGSHLRLKEYIAVVLAHELGHSEDLELEQLAAALDGPLTGRQEAEIRLRIEENAWAYAISLLTEADPYFLHMIMEESLFSYRNQLDRFRIA
ncbi:metallopeptidase family protein [Paenibacillus graminis]|uniref:metallopeptidase family protein n=1 Tax=Paenibacillus graminis TaxID=189425 RepID=UPI0009DF8D10|nr:metallopeptidase family protein [Paenibacillus graminis]